jgi:hypothetical protein
LVFPKARSMCINDMVLITREIFTRESKRLVNGLSRPGRNTAI